MKLLITATGHPQYGKVGTIIDRRGEHYAVKVPTGEGKLWTLTVVQEGGFSVRDFPARSLRGARRPEGDGDDLQAGDEAEVIRIYDPKDAA